MKDLKARKIIRLDILVLRRFCSYDNLLKIVVTVGQGIRCACDNLKN